MNNILSDNLRRLRQKKGCTQEQVAEHLGVSPQSVSRWECGATLPDVLTLPAIAAYFCVTVDDLFREGAQAYRHEADRLSSLYQATRERDDFIRADNEYRRLMDSGNHTSEDLRSYACLHLIAMWECVDKAMLAFDQVIAKGYEEDAHTYYRARQQKMQLLQWLGQGEHVLAQQHAALTDHPEDPWEHVLLLSALCEQKAFEEAWQQFGASADRHPDSAELYLYGAVACHGLGRQGEAAALLDKALTLDPGLCEARRIRAEWQETTGDWAQAADAWSRMAADLEARGFSLEAQEPRKNAENCRRKISGEG